MAVIPNTLSNRLYEPDSLRNTDSGFELSFKNRLAPSTVVGIGPLILGGETFESSKLALRLERPVTQRHGRTPGPLHKACADISEAKAVPFALNAIARISVPGRQLRPGTYELVLSLHTREVGEIVVRASDRVNE